MEEGNTKLLPKSLDDFASASFWEGFFEERGGQTFEWYCEYEQLATILESPAFRSDADVVLHAGCGNSNLCLALVERARFAHVINVDFSPLAVHEMVGKTSKRITPSSASTAQATANNDNLVSGVDSLLPPLPSSSSLSSPSASSPNASAAPDTSQNSVDGKLPLPSIFPRGCDEYMVLDCLNMPLQPHVCTWVVDKGLHDAMMKDSGEECRQRSGKLFQEFFRVLVPGGKFLMVTLAQAHVLDLLDLALQSGLWQALHVWSLPESNSQLLPFIFLFERAMAPTTVTLSTFAAATTSSSSCIFSTAHTTQSPKYKLFFNGECKMHRNDIPLGKEDSRISDSFDFLEEDGESTYRDMVEGAQMQHKRRHKAVKARVAAASIAAARSCSLYLVTLDVKPFDSDTDLAAVEAAMRALSIDKVSWVASAFERLPIAFGISKLRCKCKVNTAEKDPGFLVDEILALLDEDMVGSVDIISSVPIRY